MHKDENLNKLKPGLYCVATPIGNLGDITFRALEISKQANMKVVLDTPPKNENSQILISTHLLRTNVI